MRKASKPDRIIHVRALTECFNWRVKNRWGELKQMMSPGLESLPEKPDS